MSKELDEATCTDKKNQDYYIEKWKAKGHRPVRSCNGDWCCWVCNRCDTALLDDTRLDGSLKKECIIYKSCKTCGGSGRVRAE